MAESADAVCREGAGKGSYFIPEVGEEVRVDFEGVIRIRLMCRVVIITGATSGYGDEGNTVEGDPYEEWDEDCV